MNYHPKGFLSLYYNHCGYEVRALFSITEVYYYEEKKEATILFYAAYLPKKF